MSAITDIMGRLEGNLLAIQGYMAKFTPPPTVGPAPNTTFEQQQAPAPAPAKPTKADYDYVKKVLSEIESLAKTANDEVDKVAKVPPPPSPEGETGHSSSGQSTTTTKK